MAGFQERLSAMKGKQEAAEQKKKEDAQKASEAARLEREAKQRSELATERDQVMAEFTQDEQTANEAREAIAQADAFIAEQGENLDPEAKAEIDALKLEAEEAQQKFDELKTRLDLLSAEISAFEESAQQETQTRVMEEPGESESVTMEETPQSQEEISAERQPTEVIQEVPTENGESIQETAESASQKKIEEEQLSPEEKQKLEAREQERVRLEADLEALKGELLGEAEKFIETVTEVKNNLRSEKTRKYFEEYLSNVKQKAESGDFNINVPRGLHWNVINDHLPEQHRNWSDLKDKYGKYDIRLPEVGKGFDEGKEKERERFLSSITTRSELSKIIDQRYEDFYSNRGEDKQPPNWDAMRQEEGSRMFEQAFNAAITVRDALAEREKMLKDMDKGLSYTEDLKTDYETISKLDNEMYKLETPFEKYRNLKRKLDALNSAQNTN